MSVRTYIFYSNLTERAALQREVSVHVDSLTNFPPCLVKLLYASTCTPLPCRSQFPTFADFYLAVETSHFL